MGFEPTVPLRARRNRYVHSAYQVCDLDALAAGGEYLARPWLFPVVGHRPPHPGQPALRLLARSRRVPRRALRRRRHVRRHARARLGAVHRLRPRPVGSAGHQGLPRHQPRGRSRTKRCPFVRALRDDNEFDVNRLIGLLKVATLMTHFRPPHRRRLVGPDRRPAQPRSTPPPPPPASCSPTAPRSTPPPRSARHRRRSTDLDLRLPGDRAVPGRRPDDQLRLPRQGRGHGSRRRFR